MDTRKIIFLAAKVFLGTLMIIFGLNKFLGFIAIQPPADPVAQTFLGTMFSSYLFKVVAITEIVGGILLFIPRYAFVGMLILLPVMFNIIAFHIAHDMPGNGIWLGSTILYLVLIVFFTDRYKTIIA